MMGMSFIDLISDTHSLPELIKIKHARQNDVEGPGLYFFKENLGISHTISLSVKDD